MSKWILKEIISKDASQTSINITSNKLGKFAFIESPPGQPIGGRIFYIHSDNESIYRFYDIQGNELTTHTVAGLANAVSYTKTGTSTADKFYVYDTTNGLQSGKTWDTTTNLNRGCSSGSIGGGKVNSATMINAVGDSSNTLWYYIKHTMNANSVGGCNDWYIGSTGEMDKLRESNLTGWFNNLIWSSTEMILSTTNAFAAVWSPGMWPTWSGQTKTVAEPFAAIRSF